MLAVEVVVFAVGRRVVRFAQSEFGCVDWDAALTVVEHDLDSVDSGCFPLLASAAPLLLLSCGFLTNFESGSENNLRARKCAFLVLTSGGTNRSVRK